MHHNLGSTPHAYPTARNSQFLHSRATVLQGRVSLNSVNSVGDTEDVGRRFCVLRETKAPSTSTRRGVRRSAVDEFAHPQQALLKLHEETWAGLLTNQVLRIHRMWRSFRGVLSRWLVLHVSIIIACVTWAR